MKCKSCGSELVIPDGRTSGYCIECGTGWSVPPGESGPVLDDAVLDRIADRVAERLRAALMPPAEAENSAKTGEDDDVWSR